MFVPISCCQRCCSQFVFTSGISTGFDCRMRLFWGGGGGSSVVMYPGLIALLQDQHLPMEFTEMLLVHMLSTASRIRMELCSILILLASG